MERLLRVVLGFVAVAAIAAFVALSAVRLVCPIELGNGEGMMLESAIRIANGQPLYVEPTLHFIPFVYMPLYPTLVAGLVHLVGPELWPGRLVDLIAVFGFCGVLIYVVRRETGSALLGIAGVALFLMGHGITRGGYDVVRPDPVMLLLAFSGLAVLRFSSGAAGTVVSALLLSLGFFAKQHGLLFAVGAAGYLLFHQRSRFPLFAIALTAFAGGGFALLQQWLGPWFGFYTFDVPSHWSQFSRGRVFQYLGDVLIGKFGGLSVPVAMAVVAPGTGGQEWIWYWAALAAAGSGLLATLDPYAYFHVLMPTIAGLCVAAPIALHRLSRALSAAASASPVVGGMPVRGASGVACFVLLLQFMPLLYPMRTLLPHPGGAEVRRDFVERVRALPGRVIMPYHGYYGTLAGKGSALAVLPLDDVLRAKGNRLLRRDPQYFERMFDSLRTGPDRPLIVLDTVFAKCGDASLGLWQSLEGHYRVVGDFGGLTERLRPVAGARNAPTWIYAPVDSAGAE